MLSMREIKKKQFEELNRVIEFFGTATRLAEAIGVTKSAVSQWVIRGKISATMAREVERVTNGEFKKEELRPDIAKWLK